MHIFITGGTRGIGNGLVKEFLKKGHSVIFTGTNEANINKAAKSLEGDFFPIVMDVRNKNSIDEALKLAVSRYGHIDIWINNAGVNQENKVLTELSEENIRKVIETNVLGMIYGTQVALQQMKEQKYGRVYNMEGLGSNNMMIPKTILYASSKRLLSFFSRACNKELKEYKDIFVGTLSPGMVFTDFIKDSLDKGNKITKILANEVDEVTPYLVKKILAGKKNIVWLKTYKIIWRFSTNWLRK